MRRRAALHIAGGLFCLAAGIGIAHPGPVAPPAGPPLAPRTHGIMLYLSQPMGSGSGAAMQPRFGFRIDQVRMVGNSGAPDAGDPIQHRSLVGWQINGHNGLQASDMKLELGGRVTYDMSHGGFAMQSPSRSVMSSSTSRATPVTANGHAAGFSESNSVSEPKGFALRGLEFRDARSQGPEGASAPGWRLFSHDHDVFHEASESPSMLHDLAATAIATFKSSRGAPVQQRSRLSEPLPSMREAR